MPSSLDRLRLIFRAPRRGTTRVMGASRGTAPGMLPAVFALVAPQQRGNFIAQFTPPLRALPVCVTQDSTRVRIEVRFDTVLVVDTTLSRGIHLVAIPVGAIRANVPVIRWRVLADRGEWQSQNVAERVTGVRTAGRVADTVTIGVLRDLLRVGRWYDAVRVAVTSASGRTSRAGEWLEAVNALASPSCPRPASTDDVRY